MMHEKEVGFVLKRFLPSNQKISTLTLSRGRVDVIIKKKSYCQRLWPGMLITFTPDKIINNTLIIEEIDILYSYQQNTPNDVFWMHHFLELCYYFTPLGDQSHDTFRCLASFFSLLQTRDVFFKKVTLIKKIYVLYFLQLTGLFTEEAIKPYLLLIKNISKLSLENTDQASINTIKKHLDKLKTSDVEKINSLIVNNLKSHPRFDTFKTIRFVYTT